MLSEKQIKEIREHLDKAQNPLFLFDNDADGLCSFLLLQRYIGRGKGVAIKSFPELTVDYFRRIKELNADYIFILDKALVSKEFFKEVRQINIPVVWIDHHEFNKEEIPEFVNYYNTLSTEIESVEAVSAYCYQITGKKEDQWLAVVGCVSDKFIPDFYSDFKEKYPDLTIEFNDAFDVLYKSTIGKIARIFNFALMDRTTNVVNMLRFLMGVKTPYEVLEESSKNYTMHKRFNEINEKYSSLLEKAMESKDNSENILFFQYGGDMSISSVLANELSYRSSKKVVVVVYVAGIKANISVRGKGVRDITLKVIEGLEDATCGGHEDSVGAKVRIEDLDTFKKKLENLI